MMTVQGTDGCISLVVDGSDTTPRIHKGKDFEEMHANDGSWPEPASTGNAELSSRSAPELELQPGQQHISHRGSPL